MYKKIPQGFGLVFEYIVRLHKEYGYSIEHIQFELPMLCGWLLFGWAYANEPVNKFAGLRLMNSPSAKEADMLYNQLKQIDNKE